MTVTEESWDEAPADVPTSAVQRSTAGLGVVTPAAQDRWEDAVPAVISRPAGLDAESYIIGCCILDEGVTLKTVTDLGLTTADFVDEGRRTIYAALRGLQERKAPISLETLVEALGSRLSDAGGIINLMDLADPLKIGTTAKVGHYVTRLLQESANRRALARARDLIERSSRGEDVGEVETKTKAADLLASSLFTTAALIAKPTPIFTAGGTTVSTPGNLTALYSQAKAGKTATIGGMLAATMELPGALNDTLGFKGSNTSKKAVIHFDTEQSRYDWQQMILTSTKRANLSTPPDWLKSHNLTGMNVRECRMLLEAAMIKYAAEHGGIYALFLDGVGDLVTDVNEPKECNEFVAYLHGLAIKYDCAIILILHLNPTSESKGRGHLGSQLQRKVESNLMLEKNEDGVTRLYATQQRGKMITKDKAICFRWSDEAGMHVSVKSEPPISLKGGRPKKYTLSKFIDMMPTKKADAKTFKVLLRLANDKAGIKESAFRDLLDGAVDNGEVFQVLAPGGYLYYLNVPGAV